jgi:quercetin dioxygenase-like cupin family protein
MKITDLSREKKSKVEMEGAKNVFKQVPVGLADGTPNFSFRVFTIEPGGETPFHSHVSEHVNYIIDGKGALVDKDGRENTVKKGDFCLVLPDEKHCYRNKSADEPFIMICAVPKQYE